MHALSAHTPWCPCRLPHTLAVAIKVVKIDRDKARDEIAIERFLWVQLSAKEQCIAVLQYRRMEITDLSRPG